MRVPPSEFEIRKVDRSQDAVLRNLLNLYVHDMAEWFLIDAAEDGTYGYATEPLWDGGVDVHLAYHDRIPVGFALVGSARAYTSVANAKDLDEFFVVRRHRRAGLGRALAEHVWNLYRGPWLVRVFQGNLPALPFWRTAVSAYTSGSYAEDIRTVGERRWSYFSFDNSR